MSFNRRKNIYTLGDFHQQQPLKALSRRQNSDPFERDPFKIQSYNFRYADRPTFPLQDLGNRSSTQNNSRTTVKRFETFYYNYDFAPTRHDKENNSTNKFHEFRRRKFLYDHQQAAPVQHPAHIQQHQQAYPNTHQLLSQPARTSMFRQPTGATTCGAAGTSAAYGASTSRQNLSGFRTLHAVNAAVNTAVGHGQQQQQQQPQQQQQQASGSSQQQQQFQRATVETSSSKISLAGCGSSAGLRRLYNDVQVNCSNSNNVSNASSFADKVSSSCPRLSTSQHNRRPLQAVHVPAKHVVNARGVAEVERKPSTCSGCRINISIKGLDETQLGENLTINIEADPSKNHYQHAQPQTQAQQQQQQQPQQYQQQKAQQQQQKQQQYQEQRIQQLKQQDLSNNLARLNIKPLKEMQKPLNITHSGSSNSFVVNKNISKTSLTSSSNRQAKRFEPRPAKDYKPTSPFVVPHRPTLERVPSIVPWNLEKNRRDCYVKENTNPQVPSINEVHLAAERPLNQMRMARNTYNAALNDLKTLNNYEKLLKARAAGLAATTTTTSAMPTRSQPMKPDHKLLNIPTAANRKYEVIMAQNCAEQPRRSKRLDSLSRLSLRSPTEKCLNYSRSCITPCRSSETQFSNGRMNPQHYQSRRSLSPVSVNINVYADKLKLLRV